MRRWSGVWIAVLFGLSAAANAQIGGLPGVGGVLGRVSDTLDSTARPALNGLRDATNLATDSLERMANFVRANRATVEFDDAGQPSRARELLLLDPDPAAIARAAASGYQLIEAGNLDGLGIAYARLATPPDAGLASAIRQLRRLLPGKDITADQIHFASGEVANRSSYSSPVAPPRPSGGTVGIIDGGTLPGPRIAAQQGFAAGAPRANAHAQAIASLLRGAGTERIYVADVYGADPAGGNALAIAKALAWMSGQRVPVVSISLVGPANPLLARAIAAAQAKGVIITAAVGNDGRSAPPAFPASYSRVVAVTGIDGRGRHWRLGCGRRRRTPHLPRQPICQYGG